MEQLKEYAEHANECREAADKAPTPAERDKLLQMAERWEALARERAVHKHLEHVLADILKQSNGNGGAAAA